MMLFGAVGRRFDISCFFLRDSFADLLLLVTHAFEDKFVSAAC